MTWLSLLTMLSLNAGLDSCAGSADWWELDLPASRLGFTATIEGVEFHGRFREFEVEVCLDPESPEQAEILVTVDLAAVRTGDADRDSILASPEWFDSGNTKKATYQALGFTSKGRNSAGNNQYLSDGTLTLKSLTGPVRIRFDWIGSELGATVQGTASMTGDTLVNRMDFDVGGGDWADDALIGHLVEVQFDLRLIAADKRPTNL